MSESKTPFNKELIELLLLFSFLVLWVTVHSQPQMISDETRNFRQYTGQDLQTQEAYAVEIK